MPEAKKLLKKSIDILTHKADECIEAAHAQHTIAERQHANAEKLVVMATTLKDEAVELSGALEKSEIATAIIAVTSIKPKAA
jgi:hypothetical protein